MRQCLAQAQVSRKAGIPSLSVHFTWACRNYKSYYLLHIRNSGLCSRAYLTTRWCFVYCHFQECWRVIQGQSSKHRLRTLQLCRTNPCQSSKQQRWLKCALHFHGARHCCQKDLWSGSLCLHIQATTYRCDWLGLGLGFAFFCGEWCRWLLWPVIFEL